MKFIQADYTNILNMFKTFIQEKIPEEPCLKKIKRTRLILTDAEEEDFVKPPSPL